MSSDKRSAVLIMDYQTDIVPNFTKNDPDLTKRVNRVSDAARKKSIPVIYIVVQFRPGHPEVNDKGGFKGLKEKGQFIEGTKGASVHESVAPKPGDLTVAKRRVGAFSGSDLDHILKAKGIEHLVLMGLSTTGVLLSTVRAAYDLDYSLTVISDGSADFDPEVHRFAMEKVISKQATVMTADAYVAALAKG